MRLRHPRFWFWNFWCNRDRCRDVLMIPPFDRGEMVYYSCRRCHRLYHTCPQADYTRTLISQRQYENIIEMERHHKRFQRSMEGVI